MDDDKYQVEDRDWVWNQLLSLSYEIDETDFDVKDSLKKLVDILEAHFGAKVMNNVK